MKYKNIIFLQGDSANEALDILDDSGKMAAIDYLSQWDYGDHDDIRDDLGAGSSDRIFEHGEYILTYNLRLGYIGLSIKVATSGVV